jgi:hypothetical protein
MPSVVVLGVVLAAALFFASRVFSNAKQSAKGRLPPGPPGSFFLCRCNFQVSLFSAIFCRCRQNIPGFCSNNGQTSMARYFVSPSEGKTTSWCLRRKLQMICYANVERCTLLENSPFLPPNSCHKTFDPCSCRTTVRPHIVFLNPNG